jgi:hypothetical protein
MSLVTDCIKRALIGINRFPGALERLDVVTFQDKIRLLGPRYHRRILLGQEGQDRIGDRIARHKPLMVARLGAVELTCLHFYLKNRCRKKTTYSKKIRFSMANNAGYFPVDDDSLDAFSKFFLDHLSQVDVMAIWFNHYEDVICNAFAKDAELVHLDCLAPYHFANPWSVRLLGQKVLVVHPFAESIRRQYEEKRRLLFADPDVLPEFELKTVKAVQSIAGSEVAFATWFDAYRHMCDEMADIDFDICLIGAGAYGLPLASFAKSLGKQAIHMGGVTQILFGIRGRRWEELYADTTALLFNEHWIRPMESETPVNKDRVEKGCYW